MAEVEGDSDPGAHSSQENVRRILWIGFAGDVFIATFFIVMKDSFGLGNLAYYLACFILVAGLAGLLLIPKVMAMGQSRLSQEKKD